MAFFDFAFRPARVAAMATVLATAAPSPPHDSVRARASTRAPAPSAADRVVHDLCGRRVALLGESPTHGFGAAMDFKVQIVQRLVTECGYTALFFESGIYDFLNIDRTLAAGDTVTEPMIAAAIGGLWANRDVAPLIPFLAARLRRGSLTLGGLDDQLGRGTYAQNRMPADLVQYLGADDRSRCLGVLQKHMLWQYTSDVPYGAKDQAAILGCLDAIEAKLVAKSSAGVRALHRAMVANLKRTIRRDYDPAATAAPDRDVQLFNARDRSMYANFVWLRSRLAPGTKVIVWTANNHAAKGLSGVPGQEGRVSLGSYIQRDLKGQAFALGFSAYAGAYARAGQAPRQLDPAPDSSLEARVTSGEDASATYLDAARLRALGHIAARPVATEFSAADWSAVFDGLVVFREERPPRKS